MIILISVLLAIAVITTIAMVATRNKTPPDDTVSPPQSHLSAEPVSPPDDAHCPLLDDVAAHPPNPVDPILSVDVPHRKESAASPTDVVETPQDAPVALRKTVDAVRRKRPASQHPAPHPRGTPRSKNPSGDTHNPEWKKWNHP